MFETLRNAFKIKDIRNRILFTFFMLIVIRIGSQLPVPGVNGEVFKQWFESQIADGFGFVNAITGGSFLQMSVFALNITPYITSSIIMQLLTIAIPKLEEMQRDGEDGRKKIAEITRYLTIVLALIESIGLTVGFYRSGYLLDKSPLTIVTVVTSLTAGSAAGTSRGSSATAGWVCGCLLGGMPRSFLRHTNIKIACRNSKNIPSTR